MLRKLRVFFVNIADAVTGAYVWVRVHVYLYVPLRGCDWMCGVAAPGAIKAMELRAVRNELE